MAFGARCVVSSVGACRASVARRALSHASALASAAPSSSPASSVAASTRARRRRRRRRGALSRAAAEDAMSAHERITVRAIETATATQRTDLAVVLVTPKIPGNTGCIARTCAASRVPLHLVGASADAFRDRRLRVVAFHIT